MKTLDYILKFGCLFALSAFLVINTGPSIYEQLEKESKISNYDFINEFKITLINPIDTGYIKLNLELSDQKIYTKIIRIKDNNHKSLFHYLENQNINTVNLKIEDFPITVEREKLGQIQKIQMDADGSNVISKLSFDDVFIVGKANNVITNILYIIMGVFFTLLGLLLFFSSINLLVTNFKIYGRTGELPELWNTIDSKVEGWRYILGIKKNDKK